MGKYRDDSPLVDQMESCDKSACYYYKMFLISCLSFGVHLTRATVPIIGMILIEEGSLSPGGLGVFIGCGFIPAIFVPLYIGYIIDTTLQTTKYMYIVLAVTVVGELLFIVAIIMRNYALAACAQIIFGIGGSSVSAIQRVLVAYHIEENLAFGTALYVCMACLSKFIGKGFMGPVAVKFGLNIALFLPLFFCLSSLVVYILFVTTFADEIKQKEDIMVGNISAPSESATTIDSVSIDGVHYIELANTPSSIDSAKKLVTPKKANYFQRKRLWEKKKRKTNLEVDSPVAPASTDPLIVVKTISFPTPERPHPPSTIDMFHDQSETTAAPSAEPIYRYVIKFCESIFKLQPLVYSYVFLHMTYVITFHLLINFLPSYLIRHWGHRSFTFVGLMSSVPHLMTVIVAPLVGLIVDRWGYSLHICLLGALNTVFAFALLLYTNVSPIFGIIAISVSQALIPVLTLAKISQQATIVTEKMPSPTPGTAFGLVEMLDGIMSVLGNIAFGKLYDLTGEYQLSITCLLALSISGVLMILATFMITDDSEKSIMDFRCSTEDLQKASASPTRPHYREPEVETEEFFRSTWTQQSHGENQRLLEGTPSTSNSNCTPTGDRGDGYQSLNHSNV